MASVNDMDWPLAETVVLQESSSMRVPSLKAGCANLSLTASSITLSVGASDDELCMASAVGSLEMAESAQLHVGRCDLDIRRVCADDSNGLSGSVFVMDTGSSLTGSNSTVLADGAVRLAGANKLTLRGVTLQVASSMLWSSSGMVRAIMGANLHILAGAKMTVTTSADWFWTAGMGERPVWRNAGVIAKEGSTSQTSVFATYTQESGGSLEPVSGLVGPIVFVTPSSFSSVVFWASATDGAWEVASNWLPIRVPGPGDSVLIEEMGTYVVTISSQVAVSALQLGNDAYSTSPSLVVSFGARLNVTGGVLAIKAPKLTVRGLVDIQSGAQLDWSYPHAGAIIDGSGTLHVSQGAEAAAIRRDADSSSLSMTLTLDQVSVVNHGRFLVSLPPSSTIVMSTTTAVLNEAGAKWQFNNSAFSTDSPPHVEQVTWELLGTFTNKDGGSLSFGDAAAVEPIRASQRCCIKLSGTLTKGMRRHTRCCTLTGGELQLS
jgi:hypothetical protein